MPVTVKGYFMKANANLGHTAQSKAAAHTVVQQKAASTTFEDKRPEALAQQQLSNQIAQAQAKPNNTGMPDQLKSGIENLSGLAMDDVKVHYNSSKPASLQAHAYAQGTDIHLAPGQDQHLPHEAWHVAQQKQGRVQPTTQVNGAAVNDDVGLEHEADVMGSKALQMNTTSDTSVSVGQGQMGLEIAQRTVWTWNKSKGKWSTDDYEADYSKKPSFSGKDHGQEYDDSPKEDDDEDYWSTLAGVTKMNKIKPYLDLLDHLAGEKSGTKVTGGHLLKSMQDQWGDSLEYENIKDYSNEVWKADFSIDGVSKSGGSTMFPSSWTKADLRNELLESETIGQTITLKSGIVIEKKGGTFYPLPE